MTEYQVKITEIAQSDLLSAVSYIRDVLLQPSTAYTLYGKIKSEIFKLSTMPERYPLWTDEPWRSEGLRKMVVKNYIVLYMAESDQRVVKVLRIFYGGRNITTQLREEAEES